MIRPLSTLKVGEKGKIVKLVGGTGMIKRLSYLGFIPEQEVEVVRSAPRGPIAIRVRGTVYALGRGVADKIYVDDVQ